MFEGSEMCFEDNETCLKGAKCVLEWSEICQVTFRAKYVKFLQAKHVERVQAICAISLSSEMCKFSPTQHVLKTKAKLNSYKISEIVDSTASEICSSVSQAKYVEMCQAKHDTV
ncbi:hypothetical protein Tco_0675071 [Tanacetum coccineum]